MDNAIIEVAIGLVEAAAIRRRSVARRTATREVRRLIAKAVQRKQWGDTEGKMTRALTPFFAKQIRSAQKELGELKETGLIEKQSDTARGLAATIFNPREWDRELVDRSLPVVAEAMVEGAVSTLAMVGVELRKSASLGRKPKGYNIPVDSPIGRYRATSGRLGGDKASVQGIIAELADRLSNARLNDRQADYYMFAGGVDSSVFESSHPGILSLFDKEELTSAEAEIGNALTLIDADRLVVTKGDRLISAAAWRRQENKVLVEHLGSLSKGGGTKALSASVEEAMRSGKSLTFQSTEESVGFYEKLGFIRDKSKGEDWFTTSPTQLVGVSKKMIVKIDPRQASEIEDLTISPIPATPPTIGISTASEWLEREGIGPPLGVSTEYPQWLQREISSGLRETFKQDYWDEINDTTLQRLETYLDKGLRDGWSIGKMASNMTSIMGPEYSRARATNVARTESGNALNAGRDASIRGVQEAVGPEAAPQIGKGWLSVLGNTTRDTHADADGQMADADGNFNLAGFIIPWPSHVSLPPGERCNCQCTITMELGVGMPEAELQAALGELEEKPVDPGSVVESSYGPPVTRQLESHAKEIRDLEKERMYILNRDGTAFDRADGTRDTITLTEHQEKGLAGRITMHNHPNQGMPFSPTDVTNAIVSGELESHVVGPNGVKYKMDFSSLAGRSGEERVKIAKRVKRDFSKMNREESEKLIPLMRSGEIKPFSRDSAARGIHNTWTRIAEKHGLGYSGEPGFWQR